MDSYVEEYLKLSQKRRLCELSHLFAHRQFDFNSKQSIVGCDGFESCLILQMLLKVYVECFVMTIKNVGQKDRKIQR